MSDFLLSSAAIVALGIMAFGWWLILLGAIRQLGKAWRNE